MRSLFGSIIVNAMLLGLLLLVHARHEPKRPGPITIEMIDPPPIPEAAVSTGPSNASRGGGHPNVNPSRHTRTHVQPSKQSENPWSEVVESSESGIGHGEGPVVGDGIGTGIGFGEGGGVEGLGPIPAPPGPPPPPPPSRARSAKLRHPARERPIEDDRLYVALVTVDEDGDVVGAHMLKGAPGPRGDLASSVIWHFHYEPALDVAGRPIKSTFEQEFQIW